MRIEKWDSGLQEGGAKPLCGPSTDDIMPVQRETGRRSPPFYSTLQAPLRNGATDH